MTDALSALLDTFDRQLHDLTRRQFLVEAFKADLDKVTREAGFRVRNGVLWMMFFDTRDSLVVHLASWARAVYQPGGLIDRLRTNHGPDFPAKRPSEPRDNDPSWRERRDCEHADAVTRLFPGMSAAYPGDAQFGQLRDDFVARMKPVVDDAAENRFRPYDRDPQAEPVSVLDFGKLRDAISYSERLMNDLSMVGCHNEHGHPEMNTPKAAALVPDMVDAILLGTPRQIERVHDGLDRIAFYDELHHRHAKEPSQYFNDKLLSSSTGAAVSADRTPPRYVAFFPALPLKRNLELGEWIVGTPPDATPWASRRFRDLSESLVRSFETVGFKGGAMLWHRDRGFDGSKPPDDVSLAIHAAVTFAVLDANDRLRLTEPDDWNKARDLSTTENADLFIQPITEDDGRITHRRGGLLKSISVGNMKIGAEPPPLADAVERIDSSVPASSFLARAVYEMVRTESKRGRAVATAVEWHRVALANPEAVTIGQRLIALKTGFEALFSTSSSRVAARKLRNLFEDRTRQHLDHFPWDGLIWAPTEKRFLWRWHWFDRGEQRQIEPIGEIEDWFMALAAARNGVIHAGRLPTSRYDGPPERPLSRYVGNLFWVGERVLREAIKAKIGAEVLLCGAIARRAWAEAKFGTEVREMARRARAAAKAGALVLPPEAHPPRALSKILSVLGVPAANLVVVDVLSQPVAGYTHGASAPGGRVKMSITESEFRALRAAGAEDKLHRSWYPCP